jgi:hypothetical protein
VTLALAVLIATALVVPHRLRLDSTDPMLAVGIWMSALALRALTAAFCAIFVVLYLPATWLFEVISQWCWHTVLPFVTAHLGLDGHDVGDAALIAPSFVLALSMLSVIFGLWRAARRVQRLVRTAIGPGPSESVILGDGEVVVAAAGLRHPRVVISAGALTVFDDEELAASLDHERGHIARRHRYIFVFAELCRALGRFVPGTKSAARELAFHIERDADRYALDRRHDPAALASAICKTAESRMLAATAFSLGGGSVSRRVRALLDGGQRASTLSLRVFAAGLASVTLAAALTLPAAAHAGFHQAGMVTPTHHCPHPA